MQASIKTGQFTEDLSLIEQGAYHQAAYAAAICLRNKKSNLPPVYFRICRVHNRFQKSAREMGHGLPFSLEGGRLIDPLTVSITECVNDFSLVDQQAFKIAFEADIINLLVGAYAEIKYVNHLGYRKLIRHPISFNTMEDYFGPYWCDCTKNYLECFFNEPKQQENKIAELFSRAYCFVNKSSYWLVISKLAELLMNSSEDYCTCEQVNSFINEHQNLLP
jgi:hypothetical protein